jgi:hypothetical protein
MVATSGDRLLDRDAEEAVASEARCPSRPSSRRTLDEAADPHRRAGRSTRRPAGRRPRAGPHGSRGGAGQGRPRPRATSSSTSSGTARRSESGGAPASRPETRTAPGARSRPGTAGLALGHPLTEAVDRAVDFVARAIAAAPGLGKGHGPLNHFVAWTPLAPKDRRTGCDPVRAGRDGAARPETVGMDPGWASPGSRTLGAGPAGQDPHAFQALRDAPGRSALSPPPSPPPLERRSKRGRLPSGLQDLGVKLAPARVQPRA